LQYNAQNLGEEYRINVPTVYYAYDVSFLDYFGARGVEEVDKAVKYFNDLPAFSSMSEDLAEYPQDTTRENFKAGALQITDLKSSAMYNIMSQLGLISPEVHVWDVRSRAIQPNLACPFYNFYVIKRNFDPVTWEPSSYVNGTLYTLTWRIVCTPDFSYVVPSPVDPLSYTYRSVAGANMQEGLFLTGLTRDDVGGLRYVYRKNNFNREQLPPDVFAGLGGGGSPFAPVETNAPGQTVDTTALRAGIDKIKFERRDYDSLLGTFYKGFTNSFTAQVVTNGSMFSQSFSRAVLQPDLIFSAGNLPVDVGVPSFTIFTATVPDFDSINTGSATVNGPGSLVVGNSRGSIDIRFQKIGPLFTARYPSFLTEDSLTPNWLWGSYDGTTNEPVLYPSGRSIKDLERQVLGQ
jgi:hypothetical protein